MQTIAELFQTTRGGKYRQGRCEVCDELLTDRRKGLCKECEEGNLLEEERES